MIIRILTITPTQLAYQTCVIKGAVPGTLKYR